jgi:hypothetical protein
MSTCIPFFSALNALCTHVELIAVSSSVLKVEIFKVTPVAQSFIFFNLVFTDRKTQVPERFGKILSKSDMSFFKYHVSKFPWPGPAIFRDRRGKLKSNIGHDGLNPQTEFRDNPTASDREKRA